MLNILIVENEITFAKVLKLNLEQLGCNITGIARTAADAIDLFNTSKTELVLIDIALDGSKTGIDVARHINRTNSIPFIYLSDNYGLTSPWFKAANDTKPSNYIPKGFLPSQLWHFIEMALYSFAQTDGIELKDGQANCFIQDELFVKSRSENKWQKILADEVVFIQVNKPYCEIYVKNNPRAFLVRYSLDKVMDKFKSIQLIRLHQSHAANLHFINKYDEVNVTVILKDGKQLEVGKTFKKLLPEKVTFLK